MVNFTLSERFADILLTLFLPSDFYNLVKYYLIYNWAYLYRVPAVAIVTVVYMMYCLILSFSSSLPQQKDEFPDRPHAD